MTKINKSLNVLKFFSIFAVVCIHCYPIGNETNFSILIDGIVRFAVPIFFLISGFYSYYENNAKAMKKYKTRSIRLVKLIILSNLLYILNFNLINSIIHLNYQMIISNILSHFSINFIFEFLILNIQIERHLWFLGALLYCYLFMIVLIKIKISPKRLYKLIPILLITNILLGEIFHYNNIIIPNGYYRNFLFTGLPFFMLGYYIRDKQQFIIQKPSNNKILLLIIITICFTLLETSILNFRIDLNIGSIFLSTLLFIWCVNNPNRLDYKIIGWVGGNLYGYIYILHFLFIGILIIRLKMNFGYLNPIIIFIITIIISMILYLILKIIKSIQTRIKTTLLKTNT